MTQPDPHAASTRHDSAGQRPEHDDHQAWAGQGLAALVDERARTARRVYLTDPRTGRQLTYGGLAAATRGWRAELDARGVPAGGRVVLAVAKPLDFAPAFLGVIAAGRRAVPVAATAPGPEFARTLERLAPDLVIADPEVHSGEGFAAPDAHLRHGAGTAASATAAAGGLGGVVLSSSGTTGTPKQIFLDAGRLLHVATQVARHHRLGSRDVGYNTLPLVHVNAEVVGLLATLVAGGELVCEARFHRQGFWGVIAERGVTWINAVPAILAILAREEPPAAHATRAVRFVRSASAPLPVAVLTAFETVTGLPVIETYGMTEAGSQITANPLDARRPGSVGLPVGADVRIVGAAGRDCPPGVIGHVQVRGAGVITAYATDAGNERFRPGGWLVTGDLGWLDADGYLFLAGRTDDVINRGGEKIFPREVEEVLLADPRVARAVVYGRRHDVLGQVPVAQVEPVIPRTRRPRDADGPGDAAGQLAADLADRCAAELDRFKRPVAIEVVDDIPVGHTGKVLRRLVGAARNTDGSEAA